MSFSLKAAGLPALALAFASVAAAAAPAEPPKVGRGGLTIVAREPARTSARPPAVAVKEPTVGPVAELSEVVLNRVFLRTARAPLRDCYLRALREAPTLAGVILVRFTIGKDGAVHSAEVVSGLAPALETCVLAQVNQALFPKSAVGEILVTYPFTFRPEP